MDQLRQGPVTWLTAPPGAGKTSLVSGYLEERGLPHLWYQLDEGDTDIASFFYYLRLAAQRMAPNADLPTE